MKNSTNDCTASNKTTNAASNCGKCHNTTNNVANHKTSDVTNCK